MLRNASGLTRLNVLTSFCDHVVALQEMYRKDCNLAAQLLQCNKSLYRTQLSEVRPALLCFAVPYFYVFIVKISAAYLCSDQFNQSYTDLMDTKPIN